jgi:multidrug resistance protein, MATE family
MASDFWRVAVVGAIAADLGETQVAVFNTSYRIMWIVLVMVMALSSAAGIKMSQRLGDMDPKGAKQAGEVGIGLAFAVLVMIMVGVFFKTRMFGAIFTQDKEFLDMFEDTRVPFCLTLFLMNFSIAIERIPYSMGRTKEVFWMGLIASWGAQVPGVYLLTTYWRQDLFALYCGMAIGYGVLVILYGYISITRYDIHRRFLPLF